MLLAIEGRIGELLPSVEEVRETVGNAQRDKSVKDRGSVPVRPEGMGKHQANNARQIANHPAEVAEGIPHMPAITKKLYFYHRLLNYFLVSPQPRWTRTP